MGRSLSKVLFLSSAAADVTIPWQEGCALRESFDLSSSCGKPPALDLIPDCGSQPQSACVKKKARNEAVLSETKSIESFQQLSSLLERTADFSGGGWGSKASATAHSIQHSYSSEHALTFYSIMLGYAGEEAIENVQKLRLTSQARSKLLSDPKGFVDLYGSRFVTKIISGYEFGGFASLTAKSHTGSKSLSAFADFKSDGIFSASASASFQSRSTLKLQCSGRFKGGHDVPIGPYQTPADLVQAIGQWDKTRNTAHQPVMMVTNGWMMLEEVQQILEDAPAEVLDLFSTENVASTAMHRIAKEYAELKYLRQSAQAALAWPRTQHERSLELRQKLQGFRDQLDTRLAQMEVFNEADFRARESEIRRGDFSWFKANGFKQQLDAWMPLLPDCVEDTECRSETQRCAQESVCVEGDWENLWSRKTYYLKTGYPHLYLTHAPDVHTDWQQPVEKMKAACLEDERCRGFCNNPDDWTFFYRITNQGNHDMGHHGEGWSCFVKPSHSWKALQHSVTSVLANPPAAQQPQWKVTFETAKNLCVEGQCKAFCWNPGDWTHLYPTKPGSFENVGWYGKGWQCFERK
eukprot:Skav234585  [mRNA]  locus=scaffold313:288783:290841:- [translate_table: standard]